MVAYGSRYSASPQRRQQQAAPTMDDAMGMIRGQQPPGPQSATPPPPQPPPSGPPQNGAPGGTPGGSPGGSPGTTGTAGAPTGTGSAAMTQAPAGGAWTKGPAGTKDPAVSSLSSPATWGQPGPQQQGMGQSATILNPMLGARGPSSSQQGSIDTGRPWYEAGESADTYSATDFSGGPTMDEVRQQWDSIMEGYDQQLDDTMLGISADESRNARRNAEMNASMGASVGGSFLGGQIQAQLSGEVVRAQARAEHNLRGLEMKMTFLQNQYQEASRGADREHERELQDEINATHLAIAQAENEVNMAIATQNLAAAGLANGDPDAVQPGQVRDSGDQRGNVDPDSSTPWNTQEFNSDYFWSAVQDAGLSLNEESARNTASQKVAEALAKMRAAGLNPEDEAAAARMLWLGYTNMLIQGNGNLWPWPHEHTLLATLGYTTDSEGRPYGASVYGSDYEGFFTDIPYTPPAPESGGQAAGPWSTTYTLSPP